MRLALAGDTMLGRGVAEFLSTWPAAALVDPELTGILAAADLRVINLECCISDRGSPRRDRVFRFRAPPVAAEALVLLGIDCVTLANNHALDFGEQALLDTFAHLSAQGIPWVGAGSDEHRARAPAALEAAGFRLAVVGVTDHPAEYAATEDRPGVAFADLTSTTPAWLLDEVSALRGSADAVLVTPHWGPNMVTTPVPHVRRTADELIAAGATLVAGHSAHVFHGAAGRVLFDLGDFLDDYATDSELRNDLGLLWLVDLDDGGVGRLEVVPLKLDFCHTGLAVGADREWVLARFRAACAALGTDVDMAGGRASVVLR